VENPEPKPEIKYTASDFSHHLKTPGDLSGAKDELNKARELDYDENGIDHMYAVIDEIIEIGYDEHIDRNKL
jgi:hypothetical protein